MGEQIIEVVWEDTTNVAQWQTRDELVEWAQAGGWVARNIGYLVYEDDACVVVAARLVEDEERHIGLAERIPKRAVLSRQELHRDGPISGAKGGGSETAPPPSMSGALQPPAHSDADG